LRHQNDKLNAESSTQKRKKEGKKLAEKQWGKIIGQITPKENLF